MRDRRARELAALLDAAAGRAVAWDFDGVLTDSEWLHRRSYTEVAAVHGLELDADGYRELAGHVEERNWSHLHSAGLRTPSGGIPQLLRERATAFARHAARSLAPSWLAREAIPALAEAGHEQLVISNNEASLIRTLLAEWDFDAAVRVVERLAGADKAGILTDLLGPESVYLDDTDRYLEIARSRGAIAVGVRHGANRHATFAAADLVVSIDEADAAIA